MIFLNTEKGCKTKEKLITTAAKLFFEKGYHATGINEILDIVGVPKGSFYFHFKSKKQLASKIAEYYSDWFENLIKENSRGKTWVEFIFGLITDIKSVASCGKYKGCPLAVLGVEIAFVEPELAQKYGQAMDNVISIFSDILKRSGLNAEESVLVARRSFALYEGYLLYYRITKQIKVFDQLLQDLLALYYAIHPTIDSV